MLHPGRAHGGVAPGCAHLAGLLCFSMEAKIKSPIRGLMMGQCSLPSVLLSLKCRAMLEG